MRKTVGLDTVELVIRVEKEFDARPPVAVPARQNGTSKTPRILTASEIALLRQALKIALSYPVPVRIRT